MTREVLIRAAVRRDIWIGNTRNRQLTDPASWQAPVASEDRIGEAVDKVQDPMTDKKPRQQARRKVAEKVVGKVAGRAGRSASSGPGSNAPGSSGPEEDSGQPSATATEVPRNNRLRRSLEIQQSIELGVLHKLLIAERREEMTPTRAHLLSLLVGCAAGAKQASSPLKEVALRLEDDLEWGTTLEAINQIADDAVISRTWIEDELQCLLPSKKSGAAQMERIVRAWDGYDQAVGEVALLTRSFSDRQIQRCVHDPGMPFDLTAAEQRCGGRISPSTLQAAWIPVHARLSELIEASIIPDRTLN